MVSTILEKVLLPTRVYAFGKNFPCNWKGSFQGLKFPRQIGGGSRIYQFCPNLEADQKSLAIRAIPPPAPY